MTTPFDFSKLTRFIPENEAHLRDPDSDVTSSNVGQRVAVLAALLREPDWLVVSDAAWRLSRFGAPAASTIPVMIELLQSKDENIRGLTAAALGGFGPLAAAAVPTLLGLLQDNGKHWFQDKSRRYPVKFRAAFALAKIDSQQTAIIPVLREAMNYKALDYIRAEAFDVVGKLGPIAEVFVPELRVDENHPDQLQRSRVQRALAALDPTYVITDPLTKQTMLWLQSHGEERT